LRSAGVSLRTVERWKKPEGTSDKRKFAIRPNPPNQVSDINRHQLMDIINSKAYSNLPPCKIIPLLADNNDYIASESTVYRLLRKEN